MSGIHTTTTTSQPETETTEHAQCICPCNTWPATNVTKEELVLILNEIRNKLSINRKKTSLEKRKLISAADDRVSSAGIGYLGIGVIAFVVGGIVLIDITRIRRM